MDLEVTAKKKSRELSSPLWEGQQRGWREDSCHQFQDVGEQVSCRGQYIQLLHFGSTSTVVPDEPGNVSR